MKSFLIVCLSLAPLLSQAQKTKKETVMPPVFVGGVYANVYNAMEQNNNVVTSEVDKLTVGGGLFLRYYLGQHIGLEAGLNYGVTEKEFESYELYPSSPGVGTVTRGVRSKSINIPVQVQYHFLGRESVIRPYVGIGGGITSYTHDIEDHERDRSLAIDRTFNRTVKESTGFIQFAQGLTYQLNNKLQINEVMFYQYETGPGRQNVGLRLGVAYTIMN